MGDAVGAPPRLRVGCDLRNTWGRLGKQIGYQINRSLARDPGSAFPRRAEPAWTDTGQPSHHATHHSIAFINDRGSCQRFSNTTRLKQPKRRLCFVAPVAFCSRNVNRLLRPER